MSLPISISHERLLSLRTVVAMAERINAQPPDVWEKHLTDAKEIASNLSDLHIRDARQNGNCEKCAPEQYAHAQELAEWDAQLHLCPVHSGNTCGCDALTALNAQRPK